MVSRCFKSLLVAAFSLASLFFSTGAVAQGGAEKTEQQHADAERRDFESRAAGAKQSESEDFAWAGKHNRENAGQGAGASLPDREGIACGSGTIDGGNSAPGKRGAGQPDDKQQCKGDRLH